MDERETALTQYERSAGVLVYRVVGGRRVYLLLDYGKYWDFPKGHLEEGEDDLTAAMRELEEETGIGGGAVEFEVGFKREITYYFRRGRRRARSGRSGVGELRRSGTETRGGDVVGGGGKGLGAGSDTPVVRKDVCFFLARTDATEVRISDEHVGYEFLPFEQALVRVRFPTARELLRRAEEHLVGGTRERGGAHEGGGRIRGGGTIEAGEAGAGPEFQKGQ